MDTESEVIQQQMRQTRAALAEKLETLEDQVIGGARDAMSAVTKTVETVTQTGNDTVTGARETVQGTVAAAKDTMHETVDAVKNAFDLSHQVQQHPWTMVGTSMAAGSLTARPLRDGVLGLREAAPRLNGSYTEETHLASAPAMPASQPATHFQAPTSGLTGKFASEINKLKSLGIATAFGVLRDMVKQWAPENLASSLGDVIDSVTIKLGGEPIQGPVLPNIMPSDAGGRREHHEEHDPSHTGARRW